MISHGVANMWLGGSPSLADLGNLVLHSQFWGSGIVSTNYQDGAGEQLTNPGFESGTTGWSTSGSPTFTSVADTPYSGTYVGRVAYNASPNPYIYQVSQTIGATYRLRGAARSDGSAIPRVWDGGVTLLWEGSTSTSWQPFDVVYKAGVNHLRFYTIISSAGHVDWDADVSAGVQIECPGCTNAANLADAGNPVVQAGAAGIVPVVAPAWGGAGGLECLLYDGADDYNTCDGIAAALAGEDHPYTILLASELTAAGTYRAFWSLGTISLYDLYRASNAGVYNAIRSSTTTKNHTGSSTAVVPAVVALRFNGSTVTNYEGTATAGIVAQDYDVSSAAWDRFTLGAYRRATIANYFNGNLREVAVYDESLSDSATQNAIAIVAANSGISL